MQSSGQCVTQVMSRRRCRWPMSIGPMHIIEEPLIVADPIFHQMKDMHHFLSPTMTLSLPLQTLLFLSM